MIGERTHDGLEFRLKAKGVGRYFGAVFLLVWLCFWAVGEAIVLWLLVKGGYALLTGTPPEPGRDLLPAAPSLAVGAFLLFWLALWTLGGIGAIGALLEQLWGEDRLTAHGGGITLIRSRGPFRSSREFPRDTIRGVTLTRKVQALAVETPRQTIPLSSLGNVAEREEALVALRRELGLADSAEGAAPSALPPQWEELITPEGERALVPNLATRRAQARVAGGLTFVSGALLAVMVRAAIADLSMLPLAIIALVITAALACGTAWLARGRMEWRIGSGRLVLRRRFGDGVRDLFEAGRLELGVSTDSDGDESFTLDAMAAAGPPSVPPSASESLQRTLPQSKYRRTIVSVLNDPSVPRRLGDWLSRAADVPLEDRTSRKAREVEIAQLLERLAQTGRMGRIAASLIGRATDRSKKSA